MPCSGQGQKVNCGTGVGCSCGVFVSELRALVIEIVLATDMSFHFQQVKNMKNLLSMPEKSVSDSAEYFSGVDPMCFSGSGPTHFFRSRVRIGIGPTHFLR